MASSKVNYKTECPHCPYGEWDTKHPLTAWCRRHEAFMRVESYAAAFWVFVHDLNNGVPIDEATIRFWDIAKERTVQYKRPRGPYIRVLHSGRTFDFEESELCREPFDNDKDMSSSSSVSLLSNAAVYINRSRWSESQ